jgi:rare lipoprotein A
MRSLEFSSLLVVAVLILGACARAVVTAPPTARPSASAPDAEHKGLASWYGRQHHGKSTASGEVYDMHDLTAAHRTLPLGTRLMVTNLENGRAVEVRINDRGPFVDGRVLDVSYAAARLLGAEGAGVIPVTFRIVSLPGPLSETKPAPAPGAQFSVQLGAFTSRARAEDLRQSLEQDGSKATISESTVGGQSFYRVRLGPYPDRGAAEREARRLAERGYLTAVAAEH